MAAEENTNWSQSVTGIVIRDNKVLLARHTYGPGKGKLIVPGGYVKWQESPQEALKREYMEETGVEVEPLDVIGIRFNQKDWYVAFRAEYKGGRAVSDGDENSEVLWLDVEEALSREDVPDLTSITKARRDTENTAFMALNKKKKPHTSQRNVGFLIVKF